MNDFQKLSYFLSEKKGVLIVTFVGPLVRSNAAMLDSCTQEVTATAAKWIILNLRDVPPQADRTLYPALARLQKLVREKPAELRLSSVHPALRASLEEQGLIRPRELTNNLAEALMLIFQAIKAAA